MHVQVWLIAVFPLQQVEAYQNIIKSSKGSTGEKKLAPGFITKFLRHFPTLHNEAIDAMVDLIEDEDVQVHDHTPFAYLCPTHPLIHTT